MLLWIRGVEGILCAETLEFPLLYTNYCHLVLICFWMHGTVIGAMYYYHVDLRPVPLAVYVFLVDITTLSCPLHECSNRYHYHKSQTKIRGIKQSSFLAVYNGAHVPAAEL